MSDGDFLWGLWFVFLTGFNVWSYEATRAQSSLAWGVVTGLTAVGVWLHGIAA